MERFSRKDVEKLIDMVKNREPLWKKSCKDKYTKNDIDHLWHEIACEMKTSSQLLKPKFRELSDKFCKELKKVGMDESSRKVSTWPQFDMLTFLISECEYGIREGNFKKKTSNVADPSSSDINTLIGNANKIVVSESDLIYVVPYVWETTSQHHEESQICTVKTVGSIPKKRASASSVSSAKRAKPDSEDEEEEAFFDSVKVGMQNLPPDLKVQFLKRLVDLAKSFASSKKS